LEGVPRKGGKKGQRSDHWKKSDQLIVVLAKSYLSPDDIADTVLGYLYESEEDQPRSLF
jgi:hypothetical protein